jgi:hypothetical protein
MSAIGDGARSLERLCHDIDMQVSYARWVVARIVERGGSDDYDGVCLLEQVLTRADSLTEQLEEAAVDARETVVALDRSEGRADTLALQLKEALAAVSAKPAEATAPKKAVRR